MTYLTPVIFFYVSGVNTECKSRFSYTDSVKQGRHLGNNGDILNYLD